MGLGTRSATELAVVGFSGDPELVKAIRRPHLELAHAERTVVTSNGLPGAGSCGTFTCYVRGPEGIIVMLAEQIG